MIKQLLTFIAFFMCNITYTMHNLGTFRRDATISEDMHKALVQSNELLPKNLKTRGYHNEHALGYEGKIVCVPEPEPRLYADELFHMQDAEPIDASLAQILVEEGLEFSHQYNYTYEDHPFLPSYNKVFSENDSDSESSLLLAKAAATKFGQPYKILPAGLLHAQDLYRILKELYSREEPCTIILHQLNDEENINLVKTFIESHRDDQTISLLITSKRCLQYNATSNEPLKAISCAGRMRLLQYYLGKLPIQPDQGCNDVYLTSLAERTNGFSVHQIEGLVNNVLLQALGKPDQSAEAALITQNDVETVLKENYSMSWVQGAYATLISRYWDTKK